MHPHFLRPFYLPTSPAGVPSRHSGIVLTSLVLILVSVRPTVPQLVPDPGVAVMVSVVLVRTTWVLGTLIKVMVRVVVIAIRSTRGVVRLILLSVVTTTCWVTKWGLLLVPSTWVRQRTAVLGLELCTDPTNVETIL